MPSRAAFLMGSPGVATGSYADTAKRLAGRSLLAAASGLATVAKGVSKGVSALTASTSDKEAACCLKFAMLEWTDASAGSSGLPCCSEQHPPRQRLPVLLVGLESGFQVRARPCTASGRCVISLKALRWSGADSTHCCCKAAAVPSALHATQCCCVPAGTCKHPFGMPRLLPLPQVWRLDGANPAEMVSRRDGPVK